MKRRISEDSNEKFEDDESNEFTLKKRDLSLNRSNHFLRVSNSGSKSNENLMIKTQFNQP